LREHDGQRLDGGPVALQGARRVKISSRLNLALLGALKRDVSGLCGREELPLIPVPNRLPPTQPGFVSLRGINKDGRLSGGGREEDEDEDEGELR
jgi:hypothetical protein